MDGGDDDTHKAAHGLSDVFSSGRVQNTCHS